MTFRCPGIPPHPDEAIRALVGLAGLDVWVTASGYWMAYSSIDDTKASVIPDATLRQWQRIVRQLRGWTL